jgi:hypothetical protein
VAVVRNRWLIDSLVQAKKVEDGAHLSPQMTTAKLFPNLSILHGRSCAVTGLHNYARPIVPSLFGQRQMESGKCRQARAQRQITNPVCQYCPRMGVALQSLEK